LQEQVLQHVALRLHGSLLCYSYSHLSGLFDGLFYRQPRFFLSLPLLVFHSKQLDISNGRQPSACHCLLSSWHSLQAALSQSQTCDCSSAAHLLFSIGIS
jgi:hypothetical protein